jgi:protein-disulfide isomerase
MPAGLLSRLDSAAAPYQLGPADGQIHVVEISDYQCPACALAHQTTKGTLERYVALGLVRYTVYDVPLPVHTNAFPAAVVGRCLYDSDPATFWRYRDSVFSKQLAWAAAYPAEPLLLGLAAEAGADTAAVASCVRESGTKEVGRLRAARGIVGEAGINFTPVWLVNNKAVRWDQLEDELGAAAGSR